MAFPKAEDAKNIRNIIVRNGYQVAAVCVSGAQILQAADNLGEGMVICSYRFRDMQYDHLKECLPRDFEMLLIASEGNSGYLCGSGYCAALPAAEGT